MAVNGQREFLCQDTAAIISNLNQPAASMLHLDRDLRGASIQRVF